MNKNTLLRRIVASGALGLGAVLVTASAASAHVTVSPDTDDAGAYSLLTFSVPHGCGASPTAEVAIQIPEGVTGVTPTILAGWDVEKVTETLDEPLDDGHGGQITERVAEVVYSTNDPLPDGFRGAFEVSVKLPDTPGETLFFPALQTCVQGESAWVQIPSDGQDPHDLELPAPAVQLVASGDSLAHEGDADEVGQESGDASEQVSSATAPESHEGGPGVIGWLALVISVIGAALGGTALARSLAKN